MIVQKLQPDNKTTIKKEIKMYDNSLTTARSGSLEKIQNPSPLEIAKQRKQSLEEQLKEVDRLIKLLESNPEMEELLKLSRRYI